MTTMSPTYSVQLFPTTFPPISNDLEAEKRTFHRQRSTRRLEGARPLFLNLDYKGDVITSSPISPRTRAVRRKGQLFDSPTSPLSSTESGYLFVNTQVQSDLQLHSPSSQCMSPAGNPGNSHRGVTATRIKAAGNMARTTTEAEGPQRLAQPFLLQLRSLPVPLTANIKPSNPDVTNNPKPLSPSSSYYNMDSTTTTTSRPRHVLTADEKLRKLAKLSRTLGENIPPELVFHSSNTTPTTTHQRTTSISELKSRWKSHKLSRSLLLTSKPSKPLAVVPGAATAAPIAPQSQSTREPGTGVVHQPKTRPRSMTTLPSPTMATPLIRGASLDRPTIPPFQDITTVGPETKREREWAYRRKERDWSGEWNVKDMERVANALRGLKAS